MLGLAQTRLATYGSMIVNVHQAVGFVVLLAGSAVNLQQTVQTVQQWGWIGCNCLLACLLACSGFSSTQPAHCLPSC